MRIPIFSFVKTGEPPPALWWKYPHITRGGALEDVRTSPDSQDSPGNPRGPHPDRRRGRRERRRADGAAGAHEPRRIPGAPGDHRPHRVPARRPEIRLPRTGQGPHGRVRPAGQLIHQYSPGTRRAAGNLRPQPGSPGLRPGKTAQHKRMLRRNRRTPAGSLRAPRHIGPEHHRPFGCGLPGNVRHNRDRRIREPTLPRAR